MGFINYPLVVMMSIVFLLFDLFQFEEAAIHFAAKDGHLNIIQYLLVNGVDPNVKDTMVRKNSQSSRLYSNSLLMYFCNVR